MRARDKMLAIKDNGGHTADPLLIPKLLFLTHRICISLVLQNGLSLDAIQTDFACDLDQHGTIRKVPPIGEMCGEQCLFKVVLTAQFVCPMQQLMGVECVVHPKTIGKIEI